MKFKGTKGERFVSEDAKGISVFSKRDLIFRTENKPNKQQAKYNALLASKSLDNLELLEEVNSFLYDFSYKSKEDAFALQSKVLNAIKEATTL